MRSWPMSGYLLNGVVRSFRFPIETFATERTYNARDVDELIKQRYFRVTGETHIQWLLQDTERYVVLTLVRFLKDERKTSDTQEKTEENRTEELTLETPATLLDAVKIACWNFAIRFDKAWRKDYGENFLPTWAKRWLNFATVPTWKTYRWSETVNVFKTVNTTNVTETRICPHLTEEAHQQIHKGHGPFMRWAEWTPE